LKVKGVKLILAMRCIRCRFVATIGALALLTLPVVTQEKGGLDLHGSYDLVDGWLKQVAEDGYLLSPVTVFAESADRIFIGSLGVTPKATAPPTLTTFDPKVPGAKVDHPLVVVNRNGQVIERWTQWYDRFGSIHKVTINPYDPEKHIWVVDRASQQVMQFTHDGKTLVMALGERSVAGQDDKHFGRPSDIAFLPDGTFFVSDGYANRRVVKFDRTGKFLLAWGTEGSGPGQFKLVHSVAVDAQRRVYTVDRMNNRIQVFDENGTFLDQWPGFLNPARLFVTQDQFAWVSDSGANKFAKFDLNGKLLTTFGTGGSFPGGLAAPHDFSVDPDGNLYVANPWNFTVNKYVPRKGADPKRLIGQRYHAGT
jgi:peptidylamidoglycolate lyase